MNKVTVMALVGIALLATGCLADDETRASASLPPAPMLGSGATYYVRPNGGPPEQCDGLADRPAAENTQNCAWDHPFRALPPGGTPRIGGGDTLLIMAGEYRMGYDAAGADACEADYTWDCTMPPIPSGPDSDHPTRILGAGWDTGCTTPPQLWGAERATMVLNLTGSTHVQLACLEITDHSGCVEDHSGGLACQRDEFPYGDWAAAGLFAQDLADVWLLDLDIHGLAYAGVHAGRLRDWTMERVRLAGNGWVGWDGDLWDDGEGDANAGTLVFRYWTVEWNGCGETFPGEQPIGCWGQSAGGYGDGVGTGLTGGDWIIEDLAFLHNTSDGLDLLYVREANSSITVRRTIAAGNAGDQIKATGPAHLENVLAVSNCGFFANQPFTHHVDHCRAGGSALALFPRPGDHISVVNATLTGQGDCLLITECAPDLDCSGSETVLIRNTLLVGNAEFGSTDDDTCLAWSGFDHQPFTLDHILFTGMKASPVPCPADSLCNIDPAVANATLEAFDGRLQPASPAIDAGAPEGAPIDDLNGLRRDAYPDIGAYEWGALAGQGSRLPVSVVNDYLYQLQEIDLEAIGRTAYDLVVIDYAAEGDEASAFTAAEISALKQSPGGERIVLAYLSIGEAEDYRFYWQEGWKPGNPRWLGAENPDWEGNFQVQYWDPAWQEIVFAYLDRLLAAGFDGAYLDLVDAYEYYAHGSAGLAAGQQRETAAQEMADLIAGIRRYARARSPGFLIFVQNAAELSWLIPGYLDLVDGIGQEDIYFGYEGDDRRTPPAVSAELERHLDRFLQDGKLVLTVDYAATPAHIDSAYAWSRARGFIPFVTVRNLDQLTINPGHEPN